MLVCGPVADIASFLSSYAIRCRDYETEVIVCECLCAERDCRALDMEDDVRSVIVPAPPALALLALLGVAGALLLVLEGVGHAEVGHVRPVEVRGVGWIQVP